MSIIFHNVADDIASKGWLNGKFCSTNFSFIMDYINNNDKYEARYKMLFNRKITPNITSFDSFYFPFTLV